jgi:predicted transcriptional regulator of viral defense system
MSDLCPDSPAEREQRDTVRVAKIAERQRGAISLTQLCALGLSTSAVSRWVTAGRLHRVHPGVYAVGHRALSLDGRLRAALLYAGQDAVLSHTTAAWIWQLVEATPERIHLTVRGRRRSLPAVRVHRSRHLEKVRHRDLPVTTVARTLLDVAAMLPASQLRRALAEAEYRQLLDVRELSVALGRGRPGSKALRRALATHMPALAQTMSLLEERFLVLCESSGVPMPEVNVRVQGMLVDAVWRLQRVAVELDGHAAHASREASRMTAGASSPYAQPASSSSATRGNRSPRSPRA